MASGIVIAKAPTLFIKAEAIHTIPHRIANWTVKGKFFSINNLANHSINPDFAKPWLTIRIIATVMTAGCAKPLKDSSAGISPVMTNNNRQMIATRSCLSFPHEKRKIARARIPNTISFSIFDCLKCQFYPNATSKIIITVKPAMNPKTAKSVYLSLCVSGITSSTTTNIIAPAAKESAYGRMFCM